MKIKILISACLMGENCKYNGESNLISEPVAKHILDRWEEENLLIPVCPEILGGLPIPRPPAEIIRADGFSVLETKRGVLNQDGLELAKFFISGAIRTLNLVNNHGVKVAVFKENSPSCGVYQIYDGSFNGVLKRGCGVTTALLLKNGLTLFAESELELVCQYLSERFGLDIP